MNINKLHKHVNNLREQHGLSPKSKEEFLAELTHMQLDGKILIENGEVKPVIGKNTNPAKSNKE